MGHLLTYALPGFPIGCVYALVAAGLVLTYKTSGVFNLAFGAQGYVSAVVFYVTVEEHAWPAWAGFVLAVLVVGPLLGLVLDRGLFRFMRTAPVAVKLVSALGLLVAIPSVVEFFVGNAQKLRPPSIAPNPDHVFRWHGYFIDGNGLFTVVVTVAVIVALGLLFRFTALGLEMRAVVESPRMVQLAGINSERVASTAWVMSSVLAALAGVMLAPLFRKVEANDFTILLVAAIAAAAFGRLRSLPLTLAGGVVLGVGQNIITGYLPLGSILVTGLRPSFPFLMLVGLLLFWPGLRTTRVAADPLAACDPPPPALAATLRDDRLDRLSRFGFPVFVAVVVVSMLTWVPTHWVFVVTQGLVFSVIFLSITVLTGMSGQISLCQATFAGVGAFTAGQLATHFGLGFLPGMLAGGAIAAAVGALVAVPALRLGGLYLALATLAFALMADNVLFPLKWVGNGVTGVDVPRPQLGPVSFAGNRAFFLLALVVLAVCSWVVILVRKGTTGRYLAALRGSELAAATIGINPTRAKITAFALSAGIAGVGGALYGSLNLRTSPGDFNFFFSLVFVVLVLTTGTRTVEGAINAGMAFALIPEILGHLPERFLALEFAGFGFGAITYAKHPEGIVEAQKRRSMERLLGRPTRPARSGVPVPEPIPAPVADQPAPQPEASRS